MFNWFKKIFRRDDTIHPDNVEHEDPFAREMIAKAWNSKKMIFATRDENGNVTIKETDITKK